MVRSKRLAPIQSLAENKENKAAQSFSSASEALKMAQEKLLQLENYRVEYVSSMQMKGSKGISGAHLQQYQQFLSKIDEGIKQQKAAIVDLEMVFVQSRSKWRDKRSQAQAISKAVDKIRVQERKQQDKKEVAVADELSTQAYIRAHQSHSKNIQ